MAKIKLLESCGVIGWDDIEAICVANFALRKPFILLGKHGIAKTTCAKQLASIYPDGYRFYDATKDDLISIAGIPKPEALAAGKLEFAKHERSIWDAKVIVIDELTRANRENQNLWLEILQEKSCFGIPLSYEAVLVTMNPDSYSATFKLDEALLDRFYAIVPIPDLQEETPSKIYKKLLLTQLQERRGMNEAHVQLIQQAVDAIRSLELIARADQQFIDSLTSYIGQFMEILHNTGAKGIYISPRKSVQLMEEILALVAYFRWIGHANPIDRAAKVALVYTFALALNIEPKVLDKIHQQLGPTLQQHTLSPSERLRVELSGKSGKLLAEFVLKNFSEVMTLPGDEVDKLMMEIIPSLETEKKLLGKFWKTLSSITGHEEVKRKLEFTMLLQMNQEMTDLMKDKEPIVSSDETLQIEQDLQAKLSVFQKKTIDELAEALTK